MLEANDRLWQRQKKKSSTCSIDGLKKTRETEAFFYRNSSDKLGKLTKLQVMENGGKTKNRLNEQKL